MDTINKLKIRFHGELIEANELQVRTTEAQQKAQSTNNEILALEAKLVPKKEPPHKKKGKKS